jgi:hypothetical protein
VDRLRGRILAAQRAVAATPSPPTTDAAIQNELFRLTLEMAELEQALSPAPVNPFSSRSPR